jgi:hypothetical protein
MSPVSVQDDSSEAESERRPSSSSSRTVLDCRGRRPVEWPPVVLGRSEVDCASSGAERCPERVRRGMLEGRRLVFEEEMLGNLGGCQAAAPVCMY